MKASSTPWLLLAPFVVACIETPTNPSAAVMNAESVVQVVDTRTEQVFTGTSSYSSGKHHIAFVTTQGSKWDDIRITHGSTVITENFNSGAWNTANFELSTPTRPGSATSGAYESTGIEDPNNYTARGALRTVAEFIPSDVTPLTIEATLISSPTLIDISFLAWRSTGISIGEPNESIYLRLHNFNEGQTDISNFSDNTLGYIGAHLGDDFYRTGPIKITVTDNGSAVTVTFTPVTLTPVTYQTAGFLAPVSMDHINRVNAGSTVPLKFAITLDGKPISDRAAVQDLRVTPCTGPSMANASVSMARDLQYLAGTRQFVSLWRVPRTSGCYLAELKLTGGVSKTATFEVRR